MLTSVTLDYSLGGYFSFLMESNSTVAVTAKSTATTDSEIKLNGNSLANLSLTATSGFQSFIAGILVPAQGAWPGDVGSSTIESMRPWAQSLMSNLKDPRLDTRWVTTATGNPIPVSYTHLDVYKRQGFHWNSVRTQCSNRFSIHSQKLFTKWWHR